MSNFHTSAQFITSVQPTSTNKTIINYGSHEGDIIQLQSYLADSPGSVQKSFGGDGADIFNVQFDLPGDGTVGIDFNSGQLRSLAEMLIEPDWDVRQKRYITDVTAAFAGAAVDVAKAADLNLPLIASYRKYN